MDSEKALDMTPMVLDGTRPKFPVTIKGDNDTQVDCYMQVPVSTVRAEHFDEINKRTVTNVVNGTQKMSTLVGLSASLITRVLFYTKDNTAVPPSVIELWPSGTVEQLYERALQLIGADKEAQQSAKND